MELEVIKLTLNDVKEMFKGIKSYCYKEDVVNPIDAKNIMEPFYGVKIPIKLIKEVINGNNI
jgi:hypothetical protein